MKLFILQNSVIDAEKELTADSTFDIPTAAVYTPLAYTPTVPRALAHANRIEEKRYYVKRLVKDTTIKYYLKGKEFNYSSRTMRSLGLTASTLRRLKLEAIDEYEKQKFDKAVHQRELKRNIEDQRFGTNIDARYNMDDYVPDYDMYDEDLDEVFR